MFFFLLHEKLPIEKINSLNVTFSCQKTITHSCKPLSSGITLNLGKKQKNHPTLGFSQGTYRESDIERVAGIIAVFSEEKA